MNDITIDYQVAAALSRMYETTVKQRKVIKLLL